MLTLVAAMLAGATHIDHVNVLRVGATQRVLPFKVMAPSHNRQLLAVVHVRSRPPTRRRVEPNARAGVGRWRRPRRRAADRGSGLDDL